MVALFGRLAYDDQIDCLTLYPLSPYSLLAMQCHSSIQALRSRLSTNVQIIPAEASNVSWADVSAPDRELGRGMDLRVVGAVKESGGSNDDHQRGRRRQRLGLAIDLKPVAGESTEVRKSPGVTASERFLTSPDLLVGADGTQSLVRRFLLSGDASRAEAKRRGYVVYRGVCNAGLEVSEHERRENMAKERGNGGMPTGGGGGGGGWGLESFQTWGPGLRFASVPLARKERVRSPRGCMDVISSFPWDGAINIHIGGMPVDRGKRLSRGVDTRQSVFEEHPPS